ncbi:MAG: SNF2-related protein [Gloeotrichia echinulata HAB0833]
MFNEAGLIIAEYLARGMVQSLLVLTPASLVSQWQSELNDKFNISTITTDNRDPQQPIDEFWTNNKRIIASLNTAKSAKHYPHVTSRTWDLVVVDEAHHLKNRTTLMISLNLSRIFNSFKKLLDILQSKYHEIPIPFLMYFP